MSSSSDEQLGGGFAEVRDGTTITPVVRPRPAEEGPDAATP